jgi:Tfp pilus assembly protein FimT
METKNSKTEAVKKPSEKLDEMKYICKYCRHSGHKISTCRFLKRHESKRKEEEREQEKNEEKSFKNTVLAKLDLLMELINGKLNFRIEDAVNYPLSSTDLSTEPKPSQNLEDPNVTTTRSQPKIDQRINRPNDESKTDASILIADTQKKADLLLAMPTPIQVKKNSENLNEQSSPCKKTLTMKTDQTVTSESDSDNEHATIIKINKESKELIKNLAPTTINFENLVLYKYRKDDLQQQLKRNKDPRNVLFWKNTKIDSFMPLLDTQDHQKERLKRLSKGPQQLEQKERKWLLHFEELVVLQKAKKITKNSNTRVRKT